MTDKKYVVPNGMLQTAVVTFNTETARQGYQYVVDSFVMKSTLEAVIQYMSENPIVPTYKQQVLLRQAFSEDPSSKDPIEGQIVFSIVEWQRRMFLKHPVSPWVESIINNMRGYIPNREEANAIVEELSRVAHKWSIADYGISKSK